MALLPLLRSGCSDYVPPVMCEEMDVAGFELIVVECHWTTTGCLAELVDDRPRTGADTAYSGDPGQEVSGNLVGMGRHRNGGRQLSWQRNGRGIPVRGQAVMRLIQHEPVRSSGFGAQLSNLGQYPRQEAWPIRRLEPHKIDDRADLRLLQQVHDLTNARLLLGIADDNRLRELGVVAFRIYHAKLEFERTDLL